MDVAVFPWLFLLPLLFGVVLFSFRSNNGVAQWLNLFFHLPWIFLIVLAWKQWSANSEAEFFPVVAQGYWLKGFKTQITLGADGLNMPLIALNIFLSTCLAFYSLGKKNLNGYYLGLFAWLNAASVGSLLAADA